jgi:hypothetical protein
LSAEQVRAHRAARAKDAETAGAYRRLQAGRGTDADWQRWLPPAEVARRAALRAAYPLGDGVDTAHLAPYVHHPGSDLERCSAQVRSALAAAGLGGVPADGDIELVADDRLPGGYDPLVHEIWMHPAWGAALVALARTSPDSSAKATVFHALVHEHVHVSSPIYQHLRDVGFLDPSQRAIEEACVDTLARRVTAQLLGRAISPPNYAPLVETMTWLHARTGRDVAFAAWSQSTLAARLTVMNAAVAEALRIPGETLAEPRWLTMFRGLIRSRAADLHLLLDAPQLLKAAASEVGQPRRTAGVLERVFGRDAALVRTFREALDERAAARHRAMRRTVE